MSGTDSNTVRRAFLDYFAKQGHEPVPSAPLVPHNDPTLLFTNAGMNQFKDAFTGKARPPAPRATSAQNGTTVSLPYPSAVAVDGTVIYYMYNPTGGSETPGIYAWDPPNAATLFASFTELGASAVDLRPATPARIVGVVGSLP